MNDEADCLKLLGQHRRGETFQVGNHRFVDYLSHGSVLEDCTIEIAGASRGIIFHGATLRRCEIKMKRRFTNYSWHAVRLEQCVFQGSIFGCDFGPRPDAYPNDPVGALISCDFSQALLHMCRFFRSEIDAIGLPEWPCFTILDPEENAIEWLSIPFPESYRQVEQKLIAEAVPEYRVKGVVAHCENASEIARMHKVSIDEIGALLRGRSYIVL